jgi:DNA ligase-1
MDPVDGTLKTFQELSNRARKDVQIHDVKVAVGIFAFDLMYLNGEVCLSGVGINFTLIAVMSV